jgi:hypothetical protein
MTTRKGLGLGTGSGYRNIIPPDPRVHSQSAKGVKQPQRIPVPADGNLLPVIREGWKRAAAKPRWVDRHSVNCVVCGTLFDEREGIIGKGGEGTVCPVCQKRFPESMEHEVTELPIYQIKGKQYFRDARLGEYRNVKDPSDRMPIDDVPNEMLERPKSVSEAVKENLAYWYDKSGDYGVHDRVKQYVDDGFLKGKIERFVGSGQVILTSNGKVIYDSNTTRFNNVEEANRFIMKHLSPKVHVVEPMEHNTDVKPLGKLTFKSPVRKETAYGVVEDYGKQEQTMELIRVGKSIVIEWSVGNPDDPIDSAEIGIETVGKDVTGYDGVFEIPPQAIKLLKKAGFNTKEIEQDKMEHNFAGAEAIAGGAGQVLGGAGEVLGGAGRAIGGLGEGTGRAVGGLGEGIGTSIGEGGKRRTIRQEQEYLKDVDTLEEHRLERAEKLKAIEQIGSTASSQPNIIAQMELQAEAERELARQAQRDQERRDADAEAQRKKELLLYGRG